MKAKRFLEQMNDLPDDLLLEAEPKPAKKGFGWKRWSAVAACCCVVLGAALALPQFFPPAGETSPVNYTEIVPYDSLSFGDTYLPEGLEITGNFNASIQRISYIEQELAADYQLLALLEVTVTDVRTKEYRYDIQDSPDRVLHQWEQTVLYDLEIDQVWYGGELFGAGESLTIENNSSVLDPQYLMEIGGRYVVPVYEEGDILFYARDEQVLAGDVNRETPYASYGFFQPPIQLTTDGNYVMPDTWQILSAYSRKIQMDLSDQPESMAYYFADKMRLVTAQDFARQMGVLVDWLEHGTPAPHQEETSSSVVYSSLLFGNTYRPEGLRSGTSTMDIIPFAEENLYAGQTQVEFWEVTVTGMEAKEYRYDVASDKFQPDGVLHRQDQTMVYQVQVEQVWWGQSVQAGDTVLLEDLSYGEIDLGCLLSIGGRYVLPVYQQGDTLPVWEEVVSGDIALTSSYGIYYPYQPPIQRTTDGDYLLPSGWVTLTEISRPVEMDLSVPENEFEYYTDKMRLVAGEDFARQMAVLIQKMEA